MVRNVQFALVVMSVLSLAGCPGGMGDKLGGVPGAPSGKVDPSACGGFNQNDATKKLKGFLEAALELEAAAKSTGDDLKAACVAMGAEVGMEGLEGEIKDICPKVLETIKSNLQVGLKAGAKLTINVVPPECKVDINAAANVAASCEGSASADVGVTCNGTCSGTCDGQCEGSTGSGGECNGVCKGSCKGECAGHADIDAEASCEAKAEIQAGVNAECTEPEVEVTFEAKMVLDKSKVDAAVAALKAGLPVVATLQAKVKGPLLGAAVTTVKAGKELVEEVPKLKSALENQFLCVSGQMKGAVDLATSIQAQFDVQLEVSVEVSASASASGTAGG